MSDNRDRRWPYFPGQAVLLFAGLALVVGAFLPWALVLGRGLRASPLALSWTLWAALVTIAGSIVRWKTVVALSALAGGGTALALAVWQVARIVERCPWTLDCLPGPGIAVLLVAGTVIVYEAVSVLRARPGG